MLKLSFNGSDERLAEYLRLRGEKVLSAVQKQMLLTMLRVQQHIQTDKLSGTVLQHRSGKLIGSVRVGEVRVDGSEVVGSVQAGGGPAWYGRIHEYGGVFTAKGRISKAVGGKRGAPYQMKFPERSFMRSSLADMRSQIFEDLKAAALRGVKE